MPIRRPTKRHPALMRPFIAAEQKKETTSLFAHNPDPWSTKKMSLTHQESEKLGGDAAKRITDGLAKAVQNSFKVRPMRNITKNEVDRRVAAAYEGWRSLVHDGGYEPARAVEAVTLILTEFIDRTADGALPRLIDTGFATKLLPHNMTKNIQAERSLSALASIHSPTRGMIDPEATH